MQPLALQASNRTLIGKHASKRMRRLNNQVPAIVYGGQKPAQAITFEPIVIRSILKNDSYFSNILQLTIDNQLELVVLKAVQRHPVSSDIVHMDFQRVSDEQPINIRTTIRFINEAIAPGVKQNRGTVFHLLNEIEIKCLPKDLPDHLEVDLQHLAIEQSLHLSDISLPAGVEIPALQQGPEHDLPVVSIHKPKEQLADDTTETTDEQSAKSG